ncbi:unnamed protein product [Brassica oleracea var. botrytis]
MSSLFTLFVENDCAFIFNLLQAELMLKLMGKKNLAGAEADNMEMSPGQISDFNLLVTLPLLN